ncbi:MAG: putative DNA modification/repair radical SAM protein [Clostridia bacterium]|jgi:putative DNA modification/repair radical SAM protein|nr:putative DNA modification/repair radical SAM protein [Clostridia bacterium]
MLDAEKLEILTESAKYDVSCSSSGSARVNRNGGLGNGSVGGICHSFTPDGRCISLLKILMSNDCVYDCEYCPNRRSADVPRARITPDEICELVINFYKRNYIEGLFLSSAVFESPDKTMELLLETVTKLRKLYNFNGYIHLKGIPHADALLVHRASKIVDRMSYNIELPSENSLKLLAPQKTKRSLLLPMKDLRDAIICDKENKVRRGRVLPAGQTTQMIIGASPETDGQILKLTQALYRNMNLRRVYYSSYIPVVQSSKLPAVGAGLLREHRLYQADWLIRFYGFDVDEIVGENQNLSPEYDPKCAWALRNMHLFPVEINTAPLATLLRVPGIGAKSAYKIIEARKFAALDYDNLVKMRVVLKRAKHFITCKGKFYGSENELQVKTSLLLAGRSEVNEQTSMFSETSVAVSALTGQL